MSPFEKKEVLVKGKFPSQRDGATMVLVHYLDPDYDITEKVAFVLFGGDRFRMTYNDLYCFTLDD